MATMKLTVDMSDCNAVLRSAAALSESLPWPGREDFRARLQKLIDDGRAVAVHLPKRGGALEADASAELLDLMREFDPEAQR